MLTREKSESKGAECLTIFAKCSLLLQIVQTSEEGTLWADALMEGSQRSLSFSIGTVNAR